MATTLGVRPGGRSARVQAAVHQAVRDLQDEVGRDALSVPMIAARAGVTPSTLYRRWGDLAQLLADVALEQLRPDAPPLDTGSFAGDVLAWAQSYFDDMSSAPGRALLREVVAAGHEARARQCAEFTLAQIAQMAVRAEARGERVTVTPETVMERVVAPGFYQILFCPSGPSPETVQRWVQGLWAEVA